MFKRLYNESGSSLMETVVAMGVGAVIVYGFSTLVANNSKQSKLLNKVSDLDQYVRMIQSTMAKSYSCEETFKGKEFPSEGEIQFALLRAARRVRTDQTTTPANNYTSLSRELSNQVGGVNTQSDDVNYTYEGYTLISKNEEIQKLQYKYKVKEIIAYRVNDSVKVSIRFQETTQTVEGQEPKEHVRTFALPVVFNENSVVEMCNGGISAEGMLDELISGIYEYACNGLGAMVEEAGGENNCYFTGFRITESGCASNEKIDGLTNPDHEGAYHSGCSPVLRNEQLNCKIVKSLNDNSDKLECYDVGELVSPAAANVVIDRSSCSLEDENGDIVLVCIPPQVTCYRDKDEDGYIDDSIPSVSRPINCLPGWTEDNSNIDCDDDDASKTSSCPSEGIQFNCVSAAWQNSGSTCSPLSMTCAPPFSAVEGGSLCCIATPTATCAGAGTCWEDKDGDGYGAGPAAACPGTPGWVENNDDCDDNDINKATDCGTEDEEANLCGIAERCHLGGMGRAECFDDGTYNILGGNFGACSIEHAPFATLCNNICAGIVCYEDKDKDGFGIGPATSFKLGYCPDGFSDLNTDCDDEDPSKTLTCSNKCQDVVDGNSFCCTENTLKCCGAAGRGCRNGRGSNILPVQGGFDNNMKLFQRNACFGDNGWDQSYFRCNPNANNGLPDGTLCVHPTSAPDNIYNRPPCSDCQNGYSLNSGIQCTNDHTRFAKCGTSSNIQCNPDGVFCNGGRCADL